ncbi:Ceramide glucosyltransferase [Giardia muris]|uniref:ceramide glucosyltransferase n=1 Tax=Giardia muris TaxID=5742 RepID=A0A4Z1T7J2_GIAMU|nr:Ceramide glucosyltransferase [Giardia muris]|eukprot:TNJ29117.1 Ceramide glucosyltransferase [Giardia muris]
MERVALVASTQLSLAWGGLAISRLRLLQRAQCSSLVAVPSTASVAVILPCCGAYNFPYICERWNSQLNTAHAGPISFIFVVDSAKDPAFQSICKYLERVHQIEEAREALQTGTIGPLTKPLQLPASLVFKRISNHTVRVVEAGDALLCSQKIHNVLEALNSCTEEFVIVFDDDIRVHRSTIPSLVGALQTSPQALISTGYSVEVPVKDHGQRPPLSNAIIMVYRSINLLSFFFRRVPACWGGCFCIRRQSLLQPIGKESHPIVDLWKKGGYSEDTILSTVAQKARMQIIAPQECIFVNELPVTNTFRRSCFEYLRRQFFVLRTWQDTYGFLLNSCAAAVLLIGFPCLTLLVIIGLLTTLSAAFCCILKLLGMKTLVDRSLLLLQSLHLIPITDSPQLAYNRLVTSTGTYAFALILLAVSHNVCFKTFVSLSNSCSRDKLRTRSHVSLLGTALAFICYIFTVPVAAAAAIGVNSVDWGRLRYKVQKGSVVAVTPRRYRKEPSTVVKQRAAV